MIAFTKVALPFGWLGNMSPFPVRHRGRLFRTAEAAFQASRFSDEGVIEEIRSQKSPMGAKFVAKRNKDKMVVEPASKRDVVNMEEILRLKITQHKELGQMLGKTGDEPIMEDCTARSRGRNLFWGAALTEDGWIGDNTLGNLWMRIRDFDRTYPGCCDKPGEQA